MTDSRMPRPLPGGRRAQRGIASGWIFAGFLAIAAFFLLTEHRAHFMGALPFVLLALCPLMHFFHGGHGGHGQAGPSANQGNEPSAPDAAAQRPPSSPHQH